jgi:hypothetical protein
MKTLLVNELGGSGHLLYWPGLIEHMADSQGIWYIAPVGANLR